MKLLFVIFLLSFFFYSSPVLAERFPLDDFQTMEERVDFNLSDFDIVTDTRSVNRSGCSIDFRIRRRKVFNNQRGASNFCDDLHRSSGLRNVCYVRGFGNKYHESSFRFLGQGRGDSFGKIFNNIHDFINQSKFFSSEFDILFSNFSNSGRCH